MSHASSSPTRSGCGCGGSSGGALRAGNAQGSHGGCSCGSARGGSGCACGGRCDGCQGQDFARPRFFAGQLLTEDDLDLLTSYVVEKNRLHNRSFFGEGVVCGLLVTCDPCGGGQVAVQPGHALDCCGNDVVVSCPQVVDVNALVKRLRIEKTGGVDCGDPCSDAKAKPARPVPSTGLTGAKDEEVPALPPAEYCLYVRYCEQGTDPVSPYATDDPCGAQACETTRIREGFTFELRCRSCDEPVPDNLFSRIRECLGNLITTEKTARNARSAMLYSASLDPALRRLSLQQQPAAYVSKERVQAASEARARVEALPDKPETWTAIHLYDAADAAQTLASLVAAWHSLSREERAGVEDAAAAAEEVERAQASLARIEKVTPRDRVATLVEDPFDRDLVVATTSRALLWANPQQALKNVPAGERELMKAGVVYDKTMSASLASTLARVKANLIDRIQERGALTDCTLLRDLKAIVIPDDDPRQLANSASATLARNATEELLDALVRYLRECICAALNPPCAPCDDPAVLLACLRIEGCEVVEICNLERTFVLTPVALRYWMPFLRSIGNLIERVCCPGDRCDPPPRGRRAALSAFDAAAEPLPRAYVEQRSALNQATRWAGPGDLLDPARIAAVLPEQLSFDPENARRIAYATASVIDIVSLRQGAPVGDLLSSVFQRTIEIPAGPATPPAPPAEPVRAELKTLRADIDELKTKLASSDERNKKLEARLKRLGG